jgi:hypothetical protein
LEGFLPIFAPVDARRLRYLHRDAAERGTWQLEAKMGEVIQFISKAERERLRLIREARAIYDGVFPSSEAIAKSSAGDEQIIK